MKHDKNLNHGIAICVFLMLIMLGICAIKSAENLYENTENRLNGTHYQIEE